MCGRRVIIFKSNARDVQTSFGATIYTYIYIYRRRYIPGYIPNPGTWLLIFHSTRPPPRPAHVLTNLSRLYIIYILVCIRCVLSGQPFQSPLHTVSPEAFISLYKKQKFIITSPKYILRVCVCLYCT